MWNTTCFCKLGTTTYMFAILLAWLQRGGSGDTHMSTATVCKCSSTAQSSWREGAHSSLESLLMSCCALHVPHSRLAPACTLTWLTIA
jgi:hypothetical protein